jgi:hypothetical protein
VILTIVVSMVEPPTIGNPWQTLKKVVVLGDRGATLRCSFLVLIAVEDFVVVAVIVYERQR